ncbi:URA2 [Symbiodinium natans]|uniref:URA2 protein n=1 Tax=Symbiodinium natans TaxID=878477 RepID=A0A812SAT3_9DINO|nr:URA2 [Symbiodinium natans]
MAEGAAAMAYKPPPAADGSPRAVVPCVRLGVLMAGAFPSNGAEIDPTYAAALDATIKAFGDAGVYVFLDLHQDACATTNGGEGLPWWVTADMQERAGCCLEQCCCCCCFSGSCWSCCPERCRTSYIASPSHPLTPCCLPNCLMSCCGLGITTYDGDAEPWLAFSVQDKGANPDFMNAGNASMRQNNSDSTWSRLVTTAQLQNTMPRIYASPENSADRALYFEPYMMLVRHLCGVWDKHANVIAVELMNEPPLGGLPNLCSTLTIWRQILGFYGHVLAELDKDPRIKSPIAIDNFSSTIPGEACEISCLACSGTPSAAMKQFQSYAERNRLILSFHYYAPPANVSWEKMVELAKANAQKLGGVPVWLSEYWEASAQEMADKLALSTDLGVPATTYWQYADTTYTQTEGWYMYDEAVLSAGGVPVSSSGVINDKSWPTYQQTVRDGTFFGASITGAEGAQEGVLRLVPADSQLESRRGQAKRWPDYAKTFLHKVRRHLAAK